MQNKPNFLKTKTNATLFAAKDYEKKPPLAHSKKQTQSNPIPQRTHQAQWPGLPAL
jgi:hypothetical protein